MNIGELLFEHHVLGVEIGDKARNDQKKRDENEWGKREGLAGCWDNWRRCRRRGFSSGRVEGTGRKSVHVCSIAYQKKCL